jgi:hypothetical protein
MRITRLNSTLVRFANPIPSQKPIQNGINDFNQPKTEQRGFDSDDGAARSRREQRLRRFKMLEARKGFYLSESVRKSDYHFL